MVLVKKKDNSYRMCVDYRKLNAITKNDAFPLPSMEHLLVKVSNSKFFSTLDMKSGYYEIPVDNESKEKTAFIANNCLYHFNFLPFGMCNGPSHFSRTILALLRPLIGSCVLVYLDDIIVLGNTVDEHLANLIKVLDTLRRKGLKLKLEKCHFFQKEVTFLGHIVSAEGIRPCVDKIDAVKNFPRPKTCKETASFLGLASYYRKFIRGFSDISRPLDALKNAKKFCWEEVHERAFSKLKNVLTSDEVLAYPKFDRPFLITTDASNLAIGGVIAQTDDNGIERPIAYASRALKKEEKNYSTFDKEALAILWMLERHRFFLIGYPLIIKSDHRPLRDLFKNSKLSSRQSRWVERLLEFDIIDFQFVAGKENKVADVLSRMANAGVVTRAMRKNSSNVTNGQNADLVLSNEANDVSEDTNVNMIRDVQNDCPVRLKVEVGEWDINELIKAQNEEEWIGQLKRFVRGETTRFPANVKAPKSSFLVEDNVLYQSVEKRPGEIKFRVVLPPSFHQRALHIVHNCPLAGHLGVERTLLKAKDYYFWIGMKPAVKDFIAKCHVCNCMRSHKTESPEAGKWPVVKCKFFRVHIDLVGPFPVGNTQHKYICVMVDAFTRYTYCHAILDKSATSVAAALSSFICRFGCPRELISDNGREFINTVVAGVVEKLNIHHFSVQAYRPSANGLVEVHNREIVKLLKLIVLDKPDTWVTALPSAEFALNTAYNKSIKDTPFFLVFGQDPVLPYETILDSKCMPLYNVEDYKTFYLNQLRRIFKMTGQILSNTGDKHKIAYDERFKTKKSEMKIGDRVYLKRLQPRKHKLEAEYYGPYRIMEMGKNKATIRCIVTGKESTYHLAHMRKVCIPQEEVLPKFIYPRLELLPSD